MVEEVVDNNGKYGGEVSLIIWTLEHTVRG